MSVRKVIFWMHLLAGCSAGAVILIMSVTGVALAYEKQIIAWAERGYRVEAPENASERLPVEALLSKAVEARPETNPASIILRSDPEAPAAIGFGTATVLLNPYTGEKLGEGATKVRGFMRVMIEWHRYLGMAGEKRALGKAITGACNLAFLFLVVSGFYLWFPRKWSGAALKSIVLFGRGLSGKARDWNWHNVIGFWCAVPLFFVVGTGLFFNYAWANNALYRITGSGPPPARPAPTPAPAALSSAAPSPPAASRAFNQEGINAAWSRAVKEAGEWKTITARFGNSPSAPVVFNIEQGTVGQPHKKLQLTISRGSGELVGGETYSSYNAGRRARLWIRWIHTGEAGGVIGQGIAMLASVGGALLVLTGISLAFRRFWGRDANSS